MSVVDLEELRGQADNGDVDAMVLVGSEYLKGLNAPQDLEQGLRYMKMAADEGNAEAQCNHKIHTIITSCEGPLNFEYDLYDTV